MTVIINSGAKINWFLQVLNKRPDGYHNLYSLMCPITLADSLSITPTPQTETLRVQCLAPTLTGVEKKLNQPDNILYKAFTAFYQHPNNAAATQKGLEIILHKSVPLEAGLGGGSSNAAQLLLYLNAHCKNPLLPEELNALGQQIGADVPFFLQPPGWYLAQGTGEQLTHIKFSTPLPAFSIILLKPQHSGISTAKLFTALARGPQYKQAPLSTVDDLNSISNLHQQLPPLLHNDFLAPAQAECPILNQALNLLNPLGLSIGLSGTGSTLFAIGHSEEHTLQAYQDLKESIKNTDESAWWHCICAIDTYSNNTVTPKSPLQRALPID